MSQKWRLQGSDRCFSRGSLVGPKNEAKITTCVHRDSFNCLLIGRNRYVIIVSPCHCAQFTRLPSAGTHPRCAGLSRTSELRFHCRKFNKFHYRKFNILRELTSHNSVEFQYNDSPCPSPPPAPRFHKTDWLLVVNMHHSPKINHVFLSLEMPRNATLTFVLFRMCRKLMTRT